jgi:SRSO17 transposase
MSAMLARIHDAGSYQAFQHFITHAPWDVAPVWRRLLARIPDRRGVLILDDTGFPKQGTHSVGVQRQYSGTLGRIGNCQVGVTAALWTGARAWLLGAELYLPESWLTPERRARAHIPGAVSFQEKWRLAVTLLDRVRAAGIDMDCVTADAGYGDVLAFRTALQQRGLKYVLGVSSHTAVWIGRPSPRLGRSKGAVRAASIGATQIATWAAAQPPRRWRRVTWRNGTRRPWATRALAVRVTPVVLWRQHRPLQPIWLVAERAPSSGTGSASFKYFFSNLPATASLRTLVRAAHQRWAIEQQYQELKDELGLDHFEGRSFPGWHRHVVLTALAYAWLQSERRPGRAPAPTLPVVRGVIQEILTAHFLVTTPGYLERMMKLKDLQLRI